MKAIIYGMLLIMGIASALAETTDDSAIAISMTAKGATYLKTYGNPRCQTTCRVSVVS